MLLLCFLLRGLVRVIAVANVPILVIDVLAHLFPLSGQGEVDSVANASIFPLITFHGVPLCKLVIVMLDIFAALRCVYPSERRSRNEIGYMY